MTSYEVRRPDGFLVSDDPARLDIDTIHGFLASCYWSAGVPRQTVERSIAHSFPFGVYETQPDGTEKQVGFARVITDRTTFAYVADVFILEAYRGRGLSKLLMESILAHPELQGLRRWMLVTRDAHGLYEKVGFSVTDKPEQVMILRPNAVPAGTQAL